MYKGTRVIHNNFLLELNIDLSVCLKERQYCINAFLSQYASVDRGRSRAGRGSVHGLLLQELT